MVAHSERFMELSEKLGGMDDTALQSFFYWNNPLKLKHRSMNVVEFLMVGCAGLALVYGWLALDRWDDPTALCLWLAAVVYIIVIEVPIYFPEKFGRSENSVIFIHNEFTGGIFYDRAPYYILALYPALLVPSYVAVDQLGIFNESSGLVSGALCVAFIHHAFYQVFDHLGPQLRWWLWEYDAPTANVGLRCVPQFSLFNFSFVGALSFALVNRLLLGWYVDDRIATHDGWNWLLLIGLAVAAGFLTVITSRLLGLNLAYLARPGASARVSEVATYGVLAGAGLLTILTLLDRPSPPSGSGFLASYLPAFGVLYLATFVALWLSAAREYRRATDGITARGTPVGSLAYAAGCGLICAFVIQQSWPS